MQCLEACQRIDAAIGHARILRPLARPNPDARFASFRIGPTPYLINPEQANQLQQMGQHLKSFYRAMEELYRLSKHGDVPQFVAQYLDAGKPAWLVELAQAEAFRGQIPHIIRPDLLLTADGWKATELDSVPGSMGLLSFFEQVYTDWPLVGAGRTAAAMAAALADLISPAEQAAIVVSDECGGYRAETAWLSRHWQEAGLLIPTLRPEQLTIHNDQVRYQGQRLLLIYRFFELFDLDNIPNAKELLYLGARGKIKITPPPKPYLEEKMWFAFLHHPDLQGDWEQLLGREALTCLQELIPPTWLLCRDPVAFAGGPLGSLAKLKQTSRRQRPYVLKPSGFSPLAWGGHGFSRGKDYTTGHWAKTIDDYLALASTSPYIIQAYQQSLPQIARHYEHTSESIATFEGKLRLCPYYFLQNEQITLSGALATLVPLSKPIIHGMTDAVMVPTAVTNDSHQS